MAWPWPRVSAPTAARPSRAQSSSRALRSASVPPVVAAGSGRSAVAPRRGRGGGGSAGPQGDFAALLVEFRDALAEEVQQRGDGDGARGELEEREHLGHGLDGFGDRARLDAAGGGVDERPGVEERHPAAQDGGVVAVPGAQPPAGARGVAVQFDQSGQPGPVPARPDLGRGELQGGGRPFERVGRERGGGARAGSRRPVGDAYGVGEDRPGLAGQFRPGRGALGGPGRLAWYAGWSPPCGRWRGVAGGQVAAWSRAEYGTSREQSCP